MEDEKKQNEEEVKDKKAEEGDPNTEPNKVETKGGDTPKQEEKTETAGTKEEAKKEPKTEETKETAEAKTEGGEPKAEKETPKEEAKKDDTPAEDQKDSADKIEELLTAKLESIQDSIVDKILAKLDEREKTKAEAKGAENEQKLKEENTGGILVMYFIFMIKQTQNYI